MYTDDLEIFENCENIDNYEEQAREFENWKQTVFFTSYLLSTNLKKEFGFFHKYVTITSPRHQSQLILQLFLYKKFLEDKPEGF